MKQVAFISRHNRRFPGYDCPDKSSKTEQNLRLSQAERAMDMANGRIPIIPPAVIQTSQADSDPLPDDLRQMYGAYNYPYADPATKAYLKDRLSAGLNEYIAQREAQKKQEEEARQAQNKADYEALLKKLREDISSLK